MEEIKRVCKIDTRVTRDIRKELEIIALFEHKKLSELIRSVVESTVDRYLRNPRYKKFKRDLEARINE